VKPAARTVRRVPQNKPKTPRRKTSPAKARRGKSTTSRKPKLLARGKTRTAVKAKTVRKRVIRKPRAKASSSPVESAPTVSPAGAALEQGFEALPAEPAKAPASPGAALPGVKAMPAEAGLSIPQILLEGDEPTAPPMTGPGQKYALGPTPPGGQTEPEAAAMPEAYGTRKLLLAARDPHWLYAHWDLTPQQQRHYNALSADRHLVVRVFADALGARPVKEVHVHPESRHWFVHVDRAGTRYLAELGYYRPRRQWATIATSSPTVTPSDAISTDQTVRFATIPADVRLTELAAPARSAVPADLPPLDLRERAVAELVKLHLASQDQMSSEGVAELLRGRNEQETPAAVLVSPAPLGGEAESVTSPMGAAEQRPGGFWLNLNAELVLYGATDPEASVTVGGRPIALRPDGTFSCRFSLPDGDHTVTVSALSAEGELRQATLKFSRRTEPGAEVGAAPPDPLLEPPTTETP